MDRVVLIHGSFAFDEFDDVPNPGQRPMRLPRWWQKGSLFATRLVAVLNRVAPAGRTFSAPVIAPYSILDDLKPSWYRWLKPFARRVPPPPPPDKRSDQRVFHWSGENSEQVRRTSGARLLAHLTELNDDCKRSNGKFHVVAHSHGGNVLWETLGLAAGNPEKLSELGRWITVGTPYFRFQWDRTTFFASLFVCMLLLISLVSVPSLGWMPWKWTLGLQGGPVD